MKIIEKSKRNSKTGKMTINQQKELLDQIMATAAAIEEGRKMMSDSSAPRYSSMDALKEALEV